MMAEQSPEQIVARERHWARPVAIAAILSAVLVIGSIAAERQIVAATDDPSVLREFDAQSGALGATAAVRALGWLALLAPLLYLFRAAQARSESMKAGLVGLTVAGPLFLAGTAIIGWIALSGIGADFVAAGVEGEQAEKLADELIADSTLRNLAGGLGLAGSLGTGIGLFYSARHAMLNGLMARFWGTLGMALGVVFLVLSPIALLWFLYAGLLIGGWVRGERPPAWASGTSMPWPKGN